MTTQVHDMNISLEEKVLAKVLGVPTQGTRSLKDENGSEIFLKVCGKMDDLHVRI